MKKIRFFGKRTIAYQQGYPMKKILLSLFLLPFADVYAGPQLPVYSPPKKISIIQPAELLEASGISISRQNPGIAWLHNDSGNAPIVWAIHLQDGSCAAKVNITGASAEDMEDIALGRYNGVETLFIADTGDNDLNRGTYYINVLPEPDLTGVDNCREMSAPVKTIKFQYPGGVKYNAEALMFSEEFQKLYILTKDTTARLYELMGMNTRAGTTNALQFIGNIPLAIVTGADMSRDGKGLIIRTYDAVHEARKLPGESITQFLQAPLTAVPSPSEPQGEAVGYDINGDYYTVSEGTNPPIYKITKKNSCSTCDDQMPYN